MIPKGLDPGALFSVLLLSYLYFRTLIEIITGRFKMTDAELFTRFFEISRKIETGEIKVKPVPTGGDNLSISNQEKPVKLNNKLNRARFIENVREFPGLYLDKVSQLIYGISKPKPNKTRADYIKEENAKVIADWELITKGQANVIPAKETNNSSKVLPFRSNKNKPNKE